MSKPLSLYQPIFSALFLCLLLSSAQAQEQKRGELQYEDETREFMSPRFGTIRGWLRYSINHDFNQGISDQPSGFTLNDHRLHVPGFQSLGPDHELAIYADMRFLDFRTNAMLPSTGERFPEYLANPELSLVYKERISGDKIWGASLTVGSPSDRPFASIHELALDATAFLRLPAGQHDAWLLFINYSNAREGLQHVPMPGIAYVHEPSEDLSLLIGIPFTDLKYKPAPRWTLWASYIIPRGVHAKASYEFSDDLTIYGGFDWDSDVWFRHDRMDNDDRLFYYQKKLSGGVRWDITEDLYLDFSAGYNFDRFFFEGEDYDDRSFNRINVGDGPFLALQVGLALD